MKIVAFIWYLEFDKQGDGRMLAQAGPSFGLASNVVFQAAHAGQRHLHLGICRGDTANARSRTDRNAQRIKREQGSLPCTNAPGIVLPGADTGLGAVGPEAWFFNCVRTTLRNSADQHRIDAVAESETPCESPWPDTVVFPLLHCASSASICPHLSRHPLEAVVRCDVH